MSTVWMVGASFSIAFASSTVRLGRRSRSENCAPLLMLTMLSFVRMMVLGPSAFTLSRSDWSNPRMSDVIPTIAVMPITTPRIVSPERSLLPRRVSSAMLTTSPARLLFTAQRLDRTRRGGARRGVEAEEQPDAGGDADAEQHRPRLEPRRQRRDRGDRQGGQEAEPDADDAAEDRERHRFGEHLRQDVGAAGAERLAQPDLARPLAHPPQHDVHDD